MRFGPLLILAVLPAPMLGACERQQPAAEGNGASEAPEGDAEAEPSGKLDRSRAGAPAPATVFEDPQGDPVSLADFAGKPLLVNFWATWCAPCIQEMPTLDALAAREGEVLTVLAVSEDRQGRDKADAFFEEHDFAALEPYLDPEMELLAELQLDTLPTTILYDARGREVWRMVGIEDWSGDKAAALIAEGRAR